MEDGEINLYRINKQGGQVMRDIRHVVSLMVCIALIVALASCAGTRTKESAGEYVDDSVITSKVKAALVADPVTKAREISVETFKGVVQLSGFVGTAAEKEKASEIARKVKGVTDVRNNIIVK
jgi:osmotically-inducible protein OsmY